MYDTQLKNTIFQSAVAKAQCDNYTVTETKSQGQKRKKDSGARKTWPRECKKEQGKLYKVSKNIV